MRRAGGSPQTHLLFGDGYAEIVGHIGENAAHSHLAFQLTIGLDGDVELVAGGKRLAARAVLIAPNTPHGIGPVGRRVKSFYVEPQLQWARAFANVLGARRVMGGAEDLMQLAVPPASPSGGRAAELRAIIETAQAEHVLGDWAKAAKLSPSRFRAVCVELLGASPVRVRQWSRLKMAARELAGGAGLAEAAVAAGFADQAHLTRQFRRWFGVSPARGLASLSFRVAD